MIRLPRRSVTRFFIPLIDVMTLLFCIFLLMPVFKQNSPENPDNKEREALRKELRKKHDVLEKLRAELEVLRKRQGLPLQQRLAIRVLEIDPANGKLSYLEPGRPPLRRQIDRGETAHALIERHQDELVRQFDEATRPELHFLFLLPRVDSAFPEGDQLRTYLRWFEKVSHGIDRPSGPR